MQNKSLFLLCIIVLQMFEHSDSLPTVFHNHSIPPSRNLTAASLCHLITF